jgi:sec-independent protein translocase protein TatC
MDDTPRPLIEHLDELRRRLFWALGSWALCAGIASIWIQEVFTLLVGPAANVLRERGYTMIAIAPAELFFVYLKSALLAGFLVSLPMTLYQLWAFVAPGLYVHERRFALPFVVSTTTLFFTGALFGYWVAFPFVFQYFLSLESEMIRTSWTVQTVFGFISNMYLAFGIAFQLPVAIFFLCIAGVVTPEQLAHTRRYAIVAMFVVGAVLTPPDVVSQISLSVPLVLLYELGILASRLAIRRRARALSPATND